MRIFIQRQISKAAAAVLSGTLTVCILTGCGDEALAVDPVSAADETYVSETAHTSASEELIDDAEEDVQTSISEERADDAENVQISVSEGITDGTEESVFYGVQDSDRFLPEGEEKSKTYDDVTVSAQAFYDHVDVTVENDTGSDLDNVSVSCSTDGLEYDGGSAAIADGSSADYFIEVPMTECHMRYKITADCDGGTQVWLSVYLNYPEVKLQAAHWNRGTFDQISDSLDYHFGKHHEEVEADNMYEYILSSLQCRQDVLDDPDDFKVTKSSKGQQAHKYKNKKDYRFIIMTDADNEILSFGR